MIADSFPLGQAKNLNSSLSKKALALVEALEGKVRPLLMNIVHLTVAICEHAAWYFEKVVESFSFCSAIFFLSCG